MRGIVGLLHQEMIWRSEASWCIVGSTQSCPGAGTPPFFEFQFFFCIYCVSLYNSCIEIPCTLLFKGDEANIMLGIILQFFFYCLFTPSLDQQHSKIVACRRCVETHRLDPPPLISLPFPSSPSSPSREDTLQFLLYLSFQINPSREVPHFSFSLFLSFLQFSSDPMLDMPLHANPFPRSYGSSLPTSLTYIVLSARGFYPRRPIAVNGSVAES